MCQSHDHCSNVIIFHRPATGERQSTAENPSREETESVASVATGGGDSSQFYEAVYDYKGERDGDLAFNTGDIIQV